MGIRIMDIRTGRSWKEEFKSPYLLQKRVNKIKYSKVLRVISTWYGEAYDGR